MTDNKAPERIIAWINKDGSTQFEGDKLFPPNVEVEYVRADLRPVVKPLEWKDERFRYSPRETAESLVGAYEVLKWSSGDFGGSVPADDPDQSNTEFGGASSIEEAKAAAQADYEKRIISALDLAPVTPAQAVDVLLPLVTDDVADELRAIAEGGA